MPRSYWRSTGAVEFGRFSVDQDVDRVTVMRGFPLLTLLEDGEVLLGPAAPFIDADGIGDSCSASLDVVAHPFAVPHASDQNKTGNLAGEMSTR